jgi:hypothetical protein
MKWLKSTHYVEFNLRLTKVRSQKNCNLNANEDFYFDFKEILSFQVNYMLY